MAHWEDVKRKLIDLLGSEIFPHLLSDPGYNILLRNAGLLSLAGIKDGGKVAGTPFAKAQGAWATAKPMTKPSNIPSTKDLTTDQSKRLREAAELCVNLMVLSVDGLQCVSEEGADAKILDGGEHIYRVWDYSSNNATRHWWFSEELLNEALRESKVKGVSPEDWIRDALAISLDFGKCDRLSRIALRDAGGLPAISAAGLPMPQRMLLKDNRGRVPTADADYWRRLGKTFTGRKTQYFVPFVPPDLIKRWSWQR